jgi:hypothetical protein
VILASSTDYEDRGKVLYSLFFSQPCLCEDDGFYNLISRKNYDEALPGSRMSRVLRVSRYTLVTL